MQLNQQNLLTNQQNCCNTHTHTHTHTQRFLSEKGNEIGESKLNIDFASTIWLFKFYFIISSIFSTTLTIVITKIISTLLLIKTLFIFKLHASFSFFLSSLLSSLLFFSFLFFPFTNLVHAVAGITVDEMPLGTVVVINGIKLIKITTTNKFMAIEPFSDCNPATDMQCFDQCESWVTPATGTMNYSNANGLNSSSETFLTDLRDGKQYQIRKFADGKCWMVTSLMYGGVTDACLSRTAFDGNGSVSPTGRFGAGTYGDCRNDPGYATYLYNWQAVMQNSTAYYNTTYSGPTQNVQGLCPQGWHVPTGGPTGEQVALDQAIGGTGANGQTSGNSFTFWRPGGNFLGTYSGICDAFGVLSNQGTYGYYWSSSQASTTYAYFVGIYTGFVFPQHSYDKFRGFSVRCVKN